MVANDSTPSHQEVSAMAMALKSVSLFTWIFVVGLLAAGRSGARQPQPPGPPQPASPPMVNPAGSSAAPMIDNGPGRPVPGAEDSPMATPRRFVFQISPNEPAKAMLPRAPKIAPIGGPVHVEDLSQVPEIAFQERAVKSGSERLIVKAAHQLAKINHANAKKTDGFMAALIENRPDLAGLPLTMGDDCRTTGAKVLVYNQAARTVQRILGQVGNEGRGARSTAEAALRAGIDRAGAAPGSPAVNSAASPMPPVEAPAAEPNPSFQRLANQAEALARIFEGLSKIVTPLREIPAAAFWQQYRIACDEEDALRRAADQEMAELVCLTRIGALTHILAAESPDLRLGLVKYLGAVPHAEATKALVRMALFSPEEPVRFAAIEALKIRREKDYTDILVKGLSYPWPAVAKQAAEAVLKLERTDLVPELVALLDAPDPRLVESKEKDGTAMVRELVKVNYPRNCMLCHPPAGSGHPNPNALLAEVAVEDQPLPRLGDGYPQNTPELLIRIDATYLRPDFSLKLPVTNSEFWLEMQRFDFVVRERKLSKEEAAIYREQLKPKAAGDLIPYRKFALATLKGLTGKDAAPTAKAWRERLKLPAGD